MPMKIFQSTIQGAMDRISKRGDTAHKKIKKLDAELARYKEQMKKMRPGPALDAVRARAIRVLKHRRMYEEKRDMLYNETYNIVLDQVSFATEGLEVEDAQQTFSNRMPLFSQYLLSCLGNNKSDLENLEGSFGPCFTYRALKKATKKFSDKRVIGHGGFGKVYKGVLSDGTNVAVKRLKPGSDQGLIEFRAEVDQFLSLNHDHLVSLMGYCDERNEMILVYEYMEKGTLKSHLYGSNKPSLDWKQRLQVSIGAAKGLDYLHRGSEKGIIHRDVKSTNILLDEFLVAKVSDFGLSKTLPELDQTHVTTAVKGSFGYLDPEYYRRRRLTKKSDVYSFGVVLLEILCARLALDNTLSSEMANLSDWGILMLNKGQLEEIIDPRISGTISPPSLKMFVEIVEMCLATKGAMRPSMDDVVRGLECALQLQDVNLVTSIPTHPPVALGVGNLDIISEATTEVGAPNDPHGDLLDIPWNQIFCQTITEAEGR